MKILFLNIWADLPFGTRHLNHREHEIWHVCDPKNGLRYVRMCLADDEVSGITVPSSEDPRELLMLLQSVYAQFPFERVVALDEHTVLPAAYIREVFNIPGPRPAEVEAFRDKRRMKQILGPKGVRVIRDIEPGTITPENFRSCVIKKVDGTASGGVYLCHRYEDYAAHVDDVAEGALLEEFVEGEVYHVDGAYGPNGFVAVPHLYLNNCHMLYIDRKPVGSVGVDDPVLRQRMIDFTHDVIRGLPSEEGVFHMELIRTPDDELVFLEIAGRVGGGEVQHNFGDAYGFDLVDFHVASQLGLSPEVGKVREGVIAGWIMMNHWEHQDGIYTGLRLDPLSEDNCLHGIWQPRLGRPLIPGSTQVVKFWLRGESTEAVSRSILELFEKAHPGSVPRPQ